MKHVVRRLLPEIPETSVGHALSEVHSISFDGPKDEQLDGESTERMGDEKEKSFDSWLSCIKQGCNAAHELVVASQQQHHIIVAVDSSGNKELMTLLEGLSTLWAASTQVHIPWTGS